MKVIWICNFMLPVIAEALGKKIQNKEGWLAGLADAIDQNATENEIELILGFPNPPSEEAISGKVGRLRYFSYPERGDSLHIYQSETEEAFVSLLPAYEPDIIHVFGTEFPHALAVMNAAARLGMEKKVLVGIQGYMTAYAPVYMAGIPDYVEKRVTFRDWLRKDSLRQQKEKYEKRAVMEKKLLEKVWHITGRTEFDHDTCRFHESAQYHFMNETLRACFYDGAWNAQSCEKHRIFVSQGNYPIKGAHKAIEAVAGLVKEYPDIKLVIAGDKITAYETIKDRIKISSYGKYLRELIDQYQLQEHVVFTGSLTAQQMKTEFCKANLFLSCAVIENSPNSMGEAMLLGMPVIASRVGGVESMLSEEEGYLYDYEDVEGLQDKIRAVFEQPKSACQKGIRAQKRARVVHDPVRNYHRLLEIYQKISEE